MIKQDGGRMNIKEILKKIIYAGFRILPVERNKVLFFSYYGEQYSGSPKYISRYLAGHSKMKQVWAFTDCGKHRMRNARTVRFGHPGYYFHLATAGVIITNYRMPEEFVKRKGQTYIQTWHSSLRLKMIEKDAEDTLPENYVRMAKKIPHRSIIFWPDPGRAGTSSAGHSGTMVRLCPPELPSVTYFWKEQENIGQGPCALRDSRRRKDRSLCTDFPQRS